MVKNANYDCTCPAHDLSDEPSEKADDTIYTVNQVLQRDYRDGQIFYKVHWERYAPECDTWEPAEELRSLSTRKLFDANRGFQVVEEFAATEEQLAAMADQPCDVCLDLVFSDEDLKMRCCYCHALVHSECYDSIMSAPDETFVCLKCSLTAEERETVKCSLCNTSDGVFRRVVGSQPVVAGPSGDAFVPSGDSFVHACCAVLNPRCVVTESSEPRPWAVSGVEAAVSHSKSRTCSVCLKPGGSMLRCSCDKSEEGGPAECLPVPDCQNFVHTRCVRAPGSMWKAESLSMLTRAYGDATMIHFLCPDHRCKQMVSRDRLKSFHACEAVQSAVNGELLQNSPDSGQPPSYDLSDLYNSNVESDIESAKQDDSDKENDASYLSKGGSHSDSDGSTNSAVEEAKACRQCEDCGNASLMLLCDGKGCSRAWHTFCLVPPMGDNIPDGVWMCPECLPLEGKFSISATTADTYVYLTAPGDAAPGLSVSWTSEWVEVGQLWELKAPTDLWRKDGLVRITLCGSSLALDVSTSSQLVLAPPSLSSDTQRWRAAASTKIIDLMSARASHSRIPKPLFVKILSGVPSSSSPSLCGLGTGVLKEGADSIICAGVLADAAAPLEFLESKKHWPAAVSPKKIKPVKEPVVFEDIPTTRRATHKKKPRPTRAPRTKVKRRLNDDLLEIILLKNGSPDEYWPLTITKKMSCAELAELCSSTASPPADWSSVGVVCVENCRTLERGKVWPCVKVGDRLMIMDLAETEHNRGMLQMLISSFLDTLPEFLRYKPGSTPPEAISKLFARKPAAKKKQPHKKQPHKKQPHKKQSKKAAAKDKQSESSSSSKKQLLLPSNLAASNESIVLDRPIRRSRRTKSPEDTEVDIRLIQKQPEKHKKQSGKNNAVKKQSVSKRSVSKQSDKKKQSTKKQPAKKKSAQKQSAKKQPSKKQSKGKVFAGKKDEIPVSSESSDNDADDELYATESSVQTNEGRTRSRSTRNRSTKKQAAKKQTVKKQTAKKQTAKKQTAKKQTAKKQTAKKQTAKK
eukprot:504070_1